MRAVFDIVALGIGLLFGWFFFGQRPKSSAHVSDKKRAEL